MQPRRIEACSKHTAQTKSKLSSRAEQRQLRSRGTCDSSAGEGGRSGLASSKPRVTLKGRHREPPRRYVGLRVVILSGVSRHGRRTESKDRYSGKRPRSRLRGCIALPGLENRETWGTRILSSTRRPYRRTSRTHSSAWTRSLRPRDARCRCAASCTAACHRAGSQSTATTADTR
jgi:hypothetical protein